jgi:single-strand DNA-binding protein
MAGVNKAIVLGYLGKHPDVRDTQSGQKVATLSIATSEKWKGKDGNTQESTEWHRVVCWGKLAELAEKYLAKGRQVYVEGKLTTRTWDDNNGTKRYTTEIVARELVFIGAGDVSKAGGGSQEPPPPSDDQLPF